MSTKEIRDGKFRTIGRIRTISLNVREAVDRNGRLLGSYDVKNDETREANGQRRKGDRLELLIELAARDEEQRLREAEDRKKQEQERRRQERLDEEQRRKAERERQDKERRELAQKREEGRRREEQAAREQRQRSESERQEKEQRERERRREEERRRQDQVAHERRERAERDRQEKERREREQRERDERERRENERERGGRSPGEKCSSVAVAASVATTRPRRRMTSARSGQKVYSPDILLVPEGGSGRRTLPGLVTFVGVIGLALWWMAGPNSRESARGQFGKVEAPAQHSGQTRTSAESTRGLSSPSQRDLSKGGDTPAEETGEAVYLVLHRHGRSKLPADAMLSIENSGAPKGFCVGRLGVENASFSFVTTDSSDSRRDNLLVHLSKITALERKDAQHLRLETNGHGDWDFFAAESVLDALNLRLREQASTTE